MTKPIVKPICRRCGGDSIVCDAAARWCVDAQEWQISTTFDNETCEDCGYETSEAPCVLWEGDARCRWVEHPDNTDGLDEEILSRLNDADEIKPGFVDLSTEEK